MNDKDICEIARITAAIENDPLEERERLMDLGRITEAMRLVPLEKQVWLPESCCRNCIFDDVSANHADDRAVAYILSRMLEDTDRERIPCIRAINDAEKAYADCEERWTHQRESMATLISVAEEVVNASMRRWYQVLRKRALEDLLQ